MSNGVPHRSLVHTPYHCPIYQFATKIIEEEDSHKDRLDLSFFFLTKVSDYAPKLLGWDLGAHISKDMLPNSITNHTEKKCVAKKQKTLLHHGQKTKSPTS